MYVHRKKVKNKMKTFLTYGANKDNYLNVFTYTVVEQKGDKDFGEGVNEKSRVEGHYK